MVFHEWGGMPLSLHDLWSLSPGLSPDTSSPHVLSGLSQSHLCPIVPPMPISGFPPPAHMQFVLSSFWRAAARIRGKAGSLPFCSPLLSCLFLAQNVTLVGWSWPAASHLPATLALPLLNRTRGENKVGELMGRDTDREIIYQLPSQAKRTQCGEN